MKKRLFIAVDLSEDARARAAAYIERFRSLGSNARVSTTKAENLHLTLKFLGDVDASAVDDVIKALDRACSALPAFHLSIAGTGVFPSARKPKVLWLGVDDADDGLKAAAKAVDDELNRLGFAKEDRVFSPHLTIGRIRDSAKGRDVADRHSMLGFGPVRFNVNEMVLYDSRLSPSGSMYTLIYKIKLAG